MRRFIRRPSWLLLGLVLVGCATAPTTEAKRASLQTSAQATIQAMTARDPELATLLNHSYGYAVFPTIGKAGVVAGAAFGRGVVYRQGQLVGFAALNQGSLGAQLGAQTFSELIVFVDPQSLTRLQSGNFSIGANASAVALTAGAARTVRFVNGVAVFVMPRGGLMAELSISGQQINYQSLGG